ncbi:MAG TPA: cyclic nucleotide-binding domain-containing protein [Thermoplasmata archaeon]|nr:cyclic nucleotide-binding domain-containing protein [Thermoplasmata archaeon]HUI38828.1 cyclic nucleotide-binding domain-containing protein [Thermoplasmata archaeon]
MSDASHATLASEMSEHPFFEGVEERFLAAIAEGSVAKTYAQDEYLLREGEEARHLFLVYSGKIALEVSSPERPRHTVGTVGMGEVVGWSWSVPPHRYEHDARALKPTRTIAIDAEVLRYACEEDTATGYRLLVRLIAVVASRLASTRLQLLESEGAGSVDRPRRPPNVGPRWTGAPED